MLANRKRVVPSGSCNTNSPSNAGKGSAHESELRKQGRRAESVVRGFRKGHTRRSARSSSPRGERHAVCGICAPKRDANRWRRTLLQVQGSSAGRASDV